MPATCRRRIVRRAVMAVAGVVLVLSAYVGIYGAAHWLEGRWMSGRTPGLPPAVMRRMQQTVFAPIHIGSASGVPLCDTVYKFGVWCNYQGSGIETSWGDLNG